MKTINIEIKAEMLKTSGAVYDAINENLNLIKKDESAIIKIAGQSLYTLKKITSSIFETEDCYKCQESIVGDILDDFLFQTAIESEAKRNKNIQLAINYI